MTENTTDELRIEVSGLVSGQSGEPLVEILIGDKRVVVVPDKAREIGAMLVDCAHGAEGDAFLVSFLSKRIGADPQIAVGILQEFRTWRKARVSTTPPPSGANR